MVLYYRVRNDQWIISRGPINLLHAMRAYQLIRIGHEILKNSHFLLADMLRGVLTEIVRLNMNEV
jgi:hypothetical protein